MKIICLCGECLSDTGYPNRIEHLLIDSIALELLQDLVDNEVEKTSIVSMWPEHWRESGAIEVWKCSDCGRLYFKPKESPEKIIVYKLEQIGFHTK